MTFHPNSTINRKSFRNRKIDTKKTLRIYTPGEINEEDLIPISRAGLEIETGVEKEEEEEIHLIKALAERASEIDRGNLPTSSGAIPVPSSNKRISYYSELYKNHKWSKPSTYIRFSLPIEECIGCFYCMDEQDDAWFNEYNEKHDDSLSEDTFEEIMQHFEDIANNKIQLLTKKQLPTWEDCEECLPEKLLAFKDVAQVVYLYWKNKRNARMMRYRKPEGKEEEEHPWTCFRRRELKPIRKTRRSENASFDKLRMIRRDINHGRVIILNVKFREKTKKQKVDLERKIFEKECSVRAMRKKLGIKSETTDVIRKSRKSSTTNIDSSSISRSKIGNKIYKEDYQRTDITDYPYLPIRKSAASSLFRTLNDTKSPYRSKNVVSSAFRNRVGRGGRNYHVFDRLDFSSYNKLLNPSSTSEKTPISSKFAYDMDEMDEIFSEEEPFGNEMDDVTESINRWNWLKDEDFFNLSATKKFLKDKQIAQKFIRTSNEDTRLNGDARTIAQNGISLGSAGVTMNHSDAYGRRPSPVQWIPKIQRLHMTNGVPTGHLQQSYSPLLLSHVPHANWRIN
ncbi:14113_t:CDS:10 [Entrophospora sp. SA101]|nr:14113_t:CDS:10 [Entrophospora sp. SA101]